MALPPLPPASTRRLFLDYDAGTFQHTMMLRLPLEGATPADYATTYATIFSLRMRASESFYAARLATVGSNVTLPVPFTPVPGQLPADVAYWQQDPESAQLSFTFRGVATGRKSRVEFFTPAATPGWPPDNRYNPGEYAVIDTLRINFTNAAKTGGTHPLLTVGGDEVVIHEYVNIRLNGYWQTRQR